MPVSVSQSNNERINEIKTILRSLLISKGSRDVTIRQLNGMYREMEGTNIPFREFNYSNLDSFLHSIPDTLRLQYNRDNEMCVYHVNTEKSAHVSSLVARQKKPPRKTKSSYSHRYRVTPNHPIRPMQHYNPVSASIVSKVLQELKNSSTHSPNSGIRKADVLYKVKEQIGRYTSYTVQNLNTHLYELSYMLVIKDDNIYFKDELARKNSEKLPNPIEKPVVSDNFSLQNNEKKSNSYYNSHVDKQNIQLNGSHVDEQSIQVNGCHVDEHNIQVDGSKQDFCQISNRGEEEPQIIKINYVNDLIKERTKIRLQKLLEKHPEGIWCSELPTVYKNEYSVDLEYNDLGFNSITEFVAALPDIFLIVEPPYTKRQMVLDARKPIESSENNHPRKTMASLYNFDDYIASDPEPIPIRLSSGVSRSLIPEGVMTLNEMVDQIHVTSLIPEDYIEVIISEIFTPSFFWITLRKNKKKIKAMMSDLDEFYNYQDLDAYKIPQVVLESGLNIACIYGKQWHRGMIKKIKPDGFIVIFFYDYGTVKTYNPNDIYFLSKKFSTLPAQAIACGLHNIKPIGSSEWPNTSTNKFVNKVWNIPLIAVLSSIDEENNTMMITLTDTSDDITDLHINDWMVENELAEWGKMVHSVPIHKVCMYDETVLLKIREDDQYIQTQVNHKNTNIDVESHFLGHAPPKESCTSSNTNFNHINSCCDTENVATLLKENTHLTKQTNTLAQAILLNMPVNKFDISNTSNLDSKDTVIDNTLHENQLDMKSSQTENLNKKFSTDLNRNLGSIKVNISEMNYFGTEFMQNESVNLKQKRRDSLEHQSSQSLYSYPPSSYDNKLTQHDHINYQNGPIHSKQCSNEHSDRRSSVHSTYSYRSTVDFQPVQENNKEQQQDLDDGNIVDYERFTFKNGTPSFEIKINNGLPKSNHIKIKYPINFAEINFNKSENISNNTKVINNENLKRNVNNNEEIDEGYTTRPSTSQTQSNLSSTSVLNPTPSSSSTPIYTVMNLSARCNKKAMHIFHLDNEGWVCTSECVDAFTNLKDQRVMFKLLKFLDCEVNFKHLTRDIEPQLFSQLDISVLKVPRDENKKIVPDFVLLLMSLKSMLQVLVKLEFLNAKMAKEALNFMKECKENAEDILYEKYNSKILYDALNLLTRYKQFKRLQKISNQ